MAVWSSLSRVFQGTHQLSSVILGRIISKNAIQIRKMSSHNRFAVQPSRWQWTKTKDLVHFYFFVAAIPLGLISAYANLFIGPAELAPIPEGYVPKEWEYYRHPITRFFKKYFMEGEQVCYERHLHFLWSQYDQSEFRKIEKEVKALQEYRGDYKHWYFIQPDVQSYEKLQQDVYDALNTRTNEG